MPERVIALDYRECLPRGPVVKESLTIPVHAADS